MAAKWYTYIYRKVVNDTAILIYTPSSRCHVATVSVCPSYSSCSTCAGAGCSWCLMSSSSGSCQSIGVYCGGSYQIQNPSFCSTVNPGTSSGSSSSSPFNFPMSGASSAGISSLNSPCSQAAIAAPIILGEFAYELAGPRALFI